MSKTKNAFVVESFNLANDEAGYLPGAVIKHMPTNQFTDLEAVGLVREATAEEVTGTEAAAPDQPPAPTPRRRASKS